MNEFQIALLVVSSVWFIKYSQKVYIVSIKIMYHYHEVITTGGTGKPFQQKVDRAQQGQTAPLSGCHGNLLDTGRVRIEGCTFFSLTGLFA